MKLSHLSASIAAVPLAAARPWTNSEHIVNQTTCGGTTYQYTGLVGYGFVPSNATDKYGDTLGGIGSSIAFNQSSWRMTGDDSYEGIVYTLPDRGWNKNGTLNVQSRIHKFLVSFKLAPEATALHPAHPNLKLEYLDTLLLTGPDGEPTTGLEADANGHASYPGFPPLPAATYEGDGFGGEGPGGKRISMDTEGLALDKDGYFWVSDEYGPYIYKFDQNGKMVLALQPPSAFLPRRNGTVSFSAASPPVYDPDAMPVPEEPQSGRANNQGFEGLTLSPDGAKLHVMIQSAQNQEGGPNDPYRRPVRVLEYDISSDQPKYLHEYAVMLPTYLDKNNAEKVAAQSEIHQLPTGDFLVLARDEDCGHGQECTESMYRHADIFSITNSTTDIKGPTYDDATGAAASREGELKEGIVPAQYCQFINYNLPSQLAKFGLHNGGKQDSTLLNEKWESLALLKANPYITLPKGQNEYFLFSFSDNDYVTQDGHLNFGRYSYADDSGYNVDVQVLVFSLKF